MRHTNPSRFMPSVSDRISQSALGRLQLRLRPLLRPPGLHHAALQGQSSGHVGGNSAVQKSAQQVRNRWFAERANLGTALSEEELRHGVGAGIISGALLSD